MSALALLLVAAVLAPSPSRVQVGADEFSFALSRQTVRPGPAILQLVNYGEDEHDLALRRRAPGARTFRLRTTRPGGVRDLELRLAPGRYSLWCTLADHRSRGMRATLVVRPRS
jgi:plastocyanin